MSREHKCDGWICDGCGAKCCIRCGAWADEVYAMFYCVKCKENEADYKDYKERLANRKPRLKRPKGKQDKIKELK